MSSMAYHMELSLYIVGKLIEKFPILRRWINLHRRVLRPTLEVRNDASLSPEVVVRQPFHLSITLLYLLINR